MSSFMQPPPGLPLPVPAPGAIATLPPSAIQPAMVVPLAERATNEVLGTRSGGFMAKFQVYFPHTGNYNPSRRIVSADYVDSVGWKWRLVLHPWGHDARGCYSVFVEVVNAGALGEKFSRYVKLEFAMHGWDAAYPSEPVRTQFLLHRFNREATDFGYTRAFEHDAIMAQRNVYIDPQGFVRISVKIIDIKEAFFRVATDADLARSVTGRGGGGDFANWRTCLPAKSFKHDQLLYVIQKVAELTGVPLVSCRPWLCMQRPGGAIRPVAALLPQHLPMSICEALGNRSQYHIYLEEVDSLPEVWERRRALPGDMPPEEAGDLLLSGRAYAQLPAEVYLVFLKIDRRILAAHNPAASAIAAEGVTTHGPVNNEPQFVFIGKAMAHKSDRGAELVPIARSLAQIPDTVMLEVYEQLAPEEVRRFSGEKTVEQAGLSHGSVLLFRGSQAPAWPPAPASLASTPCVVPFNPAAAAAAAAAAQQAAAAMANSAHRAPFAKPPVTASLLSTLAAKQVSAPPSATNIAPVASAPKPACARTSVPLATRALAPAPTPSTAAVPAAPVGIVAAPGSSSSAAPSAAPVHAVAAAVPPSQPAPVAVAAPAAAAPAAATPQASAVAATPRNAGEVAVDPAPPCAATSPPKAGPPDVGKAASAATGQAGRGERPAGETRAALTSPQAGKEKSDTTAGCAGVGNKGAPGVSDGGGGGVASAGGDSASVAAKTAVASTRKIPPDPKAHTRATVAAVQQVQEKAIPRREGNPAKAPATKSADQGSAGRASGTQAPTSTARPQSGPRLAALAPTPPSALGTIDRAQIARAAHVAATEAARKHVSAMAGESMASRQAQQQSSPLAAAPRDGTPVNVSNGASPAPVVVAQGAVSATKSAAAAGAQANSTMRATLSRAPGAPAPTLAQAATSPPVPIPAAPARAPVSGDDTDTDKEPDENGSAVGSAPIPTSSGASADPQNTDQKKEGLPIEKCVATVPAEHHRDNGHGNGTTAAPSMISEEGDEVSEAPASRVTRAQAAAVDGVTESNSGGAVAPIEQRRSSRKAAVAAAQQMHRSRRAVARGTCPADAPPVGVSPVVAGATAADQSGEGGGGGGGDGCQGTADVRGLTGNNGGDRSNDDVAGGPANGGGEAGAGGSKARSAERVGVKRPAEASEVRGAGLSNGVGRKIAKTSHGESLPEDGAFFVGADTTDVFSILKEVAGSSMDKILQVIRSAERIQISKAIESVGPGEEHSWRAKQVERLLTLREKGVQVVAEGK